MTNEMSPRSYLRGGAEAAVEKNGGEGGGRGARPVDGSGNGRGGKRRPRGVASGVPAGGEVVEDLGVIVERVRRRIIRAAAQGVRQARGPGRHEAAAA